MTKSLSPVKRHRQSLQRQERNRARRSAARTAVRRARELTADGAQQEAESAVREATSILDRAASKGVLHPNNAARRKSRLMRQLGAKLAGTAEGAAGPKRRTATTTRARAATSKSKASARKTGGRTPSKKS